MSRPRHAARALVGPARRTAPSRKQRAAHSRWSGARPPDPSAPGARRRPKYPLARAPPGRREAPVASDATSGRATPAPRAIRGRGPGYISGTPHCTPLPPLIRPPKLRPARRAGGPREGIGPPPGPALTDPGPRRRRSPRAPCAHACPQTTGVPAPPYPWATPWASASALVPRLGHPSCTK